LWRLGADFDVNRVIFECSPFFQAPDPDNIDGNEPVSDCIQRHPENLLVHSMTFDFSGYRLRYEAFSKAPMTMLDAAPKEMLSAIMEITLIEMGSRSAREHWQQTQLRNLLNFATQRSTFWRSRIGRRKASDADLPSLPILTRQDLRTQVASEGSLMRPELGVSIGSHATSGSSGIPVKFHVSSINVSYNLRRSVAQYFMERRDLSLNRTRIRSTDALIKDGISVKKEKGWIGALGSLIKSGENKHIEHCTLGSEDCHKLVQELKKDDVGYLIASPRQIETLSCFFDLRFLKAAKTAMWIPTGEKPDSKLIEAFTQLAIPVRANYSSEEVGQIGAACGKYSGYYHVATSNVVVEVVDRKFDIDGMSVGKVLVTHLHSYATPFIRYDLGDLACLCEKCPCVHDGPTIYNLEGRQSSVIKRRDGSLSAFHIRGKELRARADFTEYRIRQTALDKIVIEFGGRRELNASEVAAVKTFLKERAGPEFEIEVKACEQIDWGQSRKRPGFRCEV
jgi:phenylacetate-CoA ligase